MSRTVALVMLFVVVLVTPAAAQSIPQSVRVQGYLSDRAGGTPVTANGVYNMVFEIFDVSVGGLALATVGPIGVTVTNGVYEAAIPAGPSLFSGPSRYLQITVNGEVLSPRLRIDSTPYALRSDSAVKAETVAPGSVGAAGLAPGAVTPPALAPGAVTPSALADGAVTGAKIGVPCTEGQILLRSNGMWTCAGLPAVAQVCPDGSFLYCYPGPSNTLDVGTCRAGISSCKPDRTGFTDCAGAVTPVEETCDGQDNDCDGVVDEGGACGTCGDGILQGGEACDGANLNDQSCQSLGYTGGVLACSAGCTFDTTACTGCADADGDTFPGSGCGGTDCNDANPSVHPGAAEVCDGQDNDCDGVVDEGGACGTCGNGIREAGEGCDGGDFGGLTCQDLGYAGGSLLCNQCVLDARDCTNAVCGDGVIDAGEACDGANLNGQSCQSLGYTGGVLACSAGCTFDTTACTGCPDADLDGHTSSACGGADCDDTRSNVFPGAAEVCDGRDNDCDGVVDEGGACGTCGDGILQGGEACDGANLNGQSCQSLGYTGGVLGCSAGCTFDTTACTGCADADGDTFPGSGCGGTDCDDANPSVHPGAAEVCDGVDNDCDGVVDEGGACGTCGDGILQGGEACDGANLGGQSCQSQGYTGGVLACSAGCTFDTTACTGCADADGDTFPGSGCGGTDCNDANPSVHPGAAEVCDGQDNDCDGVVDEGGACGTCGNGIREAGEGCDGGDFGGLTCQDLGYAGGSLLCNQCVLDARDCTNAVCGDGVIDAGEACDGANLNGQSCQSLGYTGGVLACSAGCTFDTTACTGCPDADLDGHTSSACGGADCDDTRSNVFPGAAEVCDGRDNDCDGVVDEGGACGTCGDGILQGGEACDGANLNGQSCQSLGYTGGVLGCSAGCTFDTSGCAP